MDIIKMFFHRRKQWKVKAIQDIPDTIENNTIYLVGEKGVWVIVFKCPCGCNESISLNTDKSEDPFWRYRISKKKISIYPSVKRIKGCRSHFFVTKSRIDFVWKSYFKESSGF